MTKPKLKQPSGHRSIGEEVTRLSNPKVMPEVRPRSQVLNEANSIDLARFIVAEIAPGDDRMINRVFHCIRQWREHQ